MRRRNPVTDDPKSWLRAKSSADLGAIYKRWHWGVGHDEEIEWHDPDMPDYLVEIGRLWELHVVPLRGAPCIIEIADAHKNASFAAFDPHHGDQRIYLLLPPAVRAVAARLPEQMGGAPASLASIAHKVGGRHAADDYPNLRVTPLGVLTDLVYRTWKKGDDDATRGSSYIHAMGEDGGIPPALTVDATGRLWLAGGSYTCPTPGITR